MKTYSTLVQENLDNKRFNKIIDFTYLKNDANIDKIKSICNEAKQYGFYSVCIKPDYVLYAKDFLKESDVKICTVISFPKGDDKTADKLREAEKAIIDGADELDMVMDYKLLKKTYKIDDPEEKQDELDYIKNDIAKIARLCHGINSVTLKVIIESGELTMEQVKDACKICVEAGADFVKTSTGFARGAEVEKVSFMRKILPDSIKIKASGGIRTIQDIEKFVKAGADRVGTSSNPSTMGM
jgi:deoxyribose-phosphate aldolase